jgi:hypothetical protein
METTKKSVRNALVVTVGCDIVGPIAVFYALRATGLSVLVASLLACLVPSASAGVQFVRRRRLDQVACLTIAVLLLAVVLALVSNDPRLVLAKDGFITGVIGLWALGTLASRRPLYFVLARPFGEETDEDWDAKWATEAGFRHRIRTITSVWGVGLAVDAVVKVALAYLLPINAVPGVAGIQCAVVFCGLVYFTVRYVRGANAQVEID